MTAQFSSHLTLDDVSYNVTDAEPYPIFHPNMLGIDVSPMGTFCWAGYIVTYECKEGQLFARSMNLGVFQDEPLVNGMKPDPLPECDDLTLALMFGRCYTDVWLPLEYTGEVLLGNDWVGRLGPGHHATPRTVEYNEIKKVVFSKGKIQQITDVSDQYAEERQALIKAEKEKWKKERKVEERRKQRMLLKRKLVGFFTRKRQPMATHRDDL
ncbi:hypothetical protein [Endozoicomonas sp. SCSIO W0465]|uniref:hypothetical protein n=1 Tax=Endozoicomonas sp. SCSIO W0465 TaxID=2918516 RepID=UPI0020757638|nr:hypothetical protein [Endozoicomonas sp. SCSIO W0465]USE36443.1 hypothetical protein MJO57_31255 [Endozoicomonas sp. SCSIO W0465]